MILPFSTRSKIALKEVGIELVYGCNLRCRMCPIVKPVPYQFMDLALLKKIINAVKKVDYRKRFFLVGRGETLLYPRLEGVFKYLAEEKINKLFPLRYLYTNATVLTPKITKILCRYNVINELFFSVSGQGTKESCDYWMGQGSWDKIVKNIKYFVFYYKRNRRFPINYQLSIIVPDYKILTVKPPFPALSKEKISKNFLRIFGKDVKIDFRPIHDYDGRNSLFTKKKYIKDGCYRLLDGDWNFKVDGSIIPCCEVANPSPISIIGNIKNDEPEKIYYSPKYQKMSHLLGTNQRDRLEMCQKCTLPSRPEERYSFYKSLTISITQLLNRR